MNNRRLAFSLILCSQLLCGCFPMQDPPQLGDDFRDKGQALMVNGKYAEAISPLKQAVDMYSVLKTRSYYYAQFDLAQCYARTGKLDEAESLLKNCQPHVSLLKHECLQELGDVAGAKKQYAEAESYYKDAIKLQEEKHDTKDMVFDRKKLAEFAEKNGDYKEAESQWIWLNQHIYKWNDGFSRAYGTFCIAEYYNRRGELKKAEEFYKATCDTMDTDYQGTKEYIGWFYMKMGDYYLAHRQLPQAKQAYQKALAMYKGRNLPESPPAPTPGIRETTSVYVLKRDQLETEKKLSQI